MSENTQKSYEDEQAKDQARKSSEGYVSETKMKEALQETLGAKIVTATTGHLFVCDKHEKKDTDPLLPTIQMMEGNVEDAVIARKRIFADRETQIGLPKFLSPEHIIPEAMLKGAISACNGGKSISKDRFAEFLTKESYRSMQSGEDFHNPMKSEWERFLPNEFNIPLKDDDIAKQNFAMSVEAKNNKLLDFLETTCRDILNKGMFPELLLDRNLGENEGERKEHRERTISIGLLMAKEIAARALVPGVKADYSTILIGNQGARKSTFFQLIFPPRLFSDAKVEELQDMRGLAAQTTHLNGFEISDWQIMNKKLEAQVTSQRTRPFIKIRILHTDQMMTVGMQTVIFGTANPVDGEFILPNTDESGVRRDMPIGTDAKGNEATKADIKNGLEHIKAAEAAHLIQECVSWYIAGIKHQKEYLKNNQGVTDDFIFAQKLGIFTLPPENLHGDEWKQATRYKDYGLINFINQTLPDDGRIDFEEEPGDLINVLKQSWRAGEFGHELRTRTRSPIFSALREAGFETYVVKIPKTRKTYKTWMRNKPENLTPNEAMKEPNAVPVYKKRIIRGGYDGGVSAKKGFTR